MSVWVTAVPDLVTIPPTERQLFAAISLATPHSGVWRTALLDDTHQLHKRLIARIAEQLDGSVGLSEPYATQEIASDAPPTRPHTAAPGESAH